MKIIIGVDTGGYYKATLNLAARLQFSDPHWTLAHSVDVAIPLGGYGMAAEASYGVEIVRLANEFGEQALEQAKDDACAHGLNAETAMLVGGAAAALAQYAEDVHADLVGVHSERKGAFGSLFMGSVSRGIAIGAKHSVLISKGSIAPSGPLTAVFATDHSEYANKALDAFISMGAKGIKSIQVVSALHLGEPQASEHHDLITSHPPMVEWLRSEAVKKTDEVAEKLRAAGYVAVGEVVDASANDAIRHAMESSKADLLVMGAQGHGFMHRLVLGSTSLHQVVVEPYPLLIVRP